jgi:hypothetical protein
MVDAMVAQLSACSEPISFANSAAGVIAAATSAPLGESFLVKSASALTTSLVTAVHVAAEAAEAPARGMWWGVWWVMVAAADAAATEVRMLPPATVSVAIQRTVFFCTIDLFQANPPQFRSRGAQPLHAST